MEGKSNLDTSVIDFLLSLDIDDEDVETIKLKLKENGYKTLQNLIADPPKSIDQLVTLVGVPLRWANKIFDALGKLGQPTEIKLAPPNGSVIKKINEAEYFKKMIACDHVKQCLVNLSGTQFSPPPELKCYTGSPLISSNLPCSISSNELDLRLIQDHLGKLGLKSPVVEEIQDHLTKSANKEFCEPVLLLTGSGVGKTKVMFDLLREHYGIYWDFTRSIEKLDISAFYKEIDSIVSEGKRKGTPYEDLCVREIFILITSRLVALILCLYQGVISSPEQWFFMQLSTLASDTKCYSNGLNLVREYLRLKITRTTHFFDFFSFFEDVIKSRIFVMVDEANELLIRHPFSFLKTSDRRSVSPNTNQHDPARPLFSLFSSEISSIRSVSMVVAGTRLDLKDKDHWSSLLAKLGTGAPLFPKQISENFPSLTLQSLKDFLPYLISSQKTRELVEKYFAEHIKTKGRFRYLTTFISCYLINAKTENEVELLLKNFFTTLLSGDEIWTLRSMIKRFETRSPISTVRNILCEITLSYLCSHGVIKMTDENFSLLSEGFCKISRISNNEYQYVVDEPLIFDAISLYLATTNTKLADYYVSSLAMAPNNSTAGVLLDLLFALCLFDLRGKPLNTIPCFQFIPEIQDEPIQVDNIVRWVQNDLVPQSSLSSLMATRRGLFLPKHLSGPDVIYISPSVLIITGNKTNSVQAVKKIEVEENFRTTDIKEIYPESEERGTILDNIYSNPPNVIVRIHNLLPHPPRTSNIYSVQNYSDMIIKLNDTEIPCPTHPSKKKRVENSTPANIHIPTYAINLNYFNIDSSGLYSPFVAKTLCLLYSPTSSFKDDPKQKITGIISETSLNELMEKKKIADEAKRVQEDKERKERQEKRAQDKRDQKVREKKKKQEEKEKLIDDSEKSMRKKGKRKSRRSEKLTDDDSEKSIDDNNEKSIDDKKEKKKKQKEKLTDDDSEKSIDDNNEKSIDDKKEKKKKQKEKLTDDDSENNEKSKSNSKKRTK
eukprot:TRINITY_DN483_c0_g5_i1.p1 TRINITY_DN483_c0_g5~~TRINITY_DN483_c0_g5_i1.p1  ORF type:complete len:1004 (+),score=211.79 TRINITY_DN483_c0_g5_i1:131-3142(+)